MRFGKAREARYMREGEVWVAEAVMGNERRRNMGSERNEGWGK